MAHGERQFAARRLRSLVLFGRPRLDIRCSGERRWTRGTHEGYVTDVLNEEGLEFVRRKHSKPFLLYMSHKAIHPETYQGPDGKLSDPTMSNFMPASRHASLYEGVKVPRRPNAG